MNRAAAVRCRAGLLGAAVTLGAGGVVRVAGAPALGLLHAPAGDFAGLLVQACALAALLATALLALTAADVVLGQWRSPGAGTRRPVGPVRAALLAACGVAVLAGPATATGEPTGPTPAAPGTLAGLPLPDRPVDGTTAPTAQAVVVRPGDSLWTIAHQALGPHARPGEVAVYLHRIHRHNAAAIGPDPDLLHPGQRLTLPARP